MGKSRILVAIYVVLFLAAGGRSTFQIIREFDVAPLAYTLSAVAAVVYLLAGIALALADHSAVWRRLAWVALGFEFVGVITVGVLSDLYIPLVLPLAGFSVLETRSRAERAGFAAAVTA